MLAGIGATPGLLFTRALVSVAADALSDALYAGSNAGLDGECGIFAAAALAIVSAAWLLTNTLSRCPRTQ